MSWMLSCIGCGTKNLPDKDETRVLDFQHFSLQSVPPCVFECERFLEELFLDYNQISELPKELFHCHELTILSLSDNDLRNLPDAVSSLTNLTSLDLSKNGISDIPESIKGCKRLAIVNASTNPLYKLPEGFTQLIALKELCLSDTLLEYLPANFGRLTGLEVLELRENQLNTLPRSMTRLTALKRLDLGQNEFTELPEVVGHLTNLTDLWFDNNRIKRLPPEIGNLSQLSFVDASKNRLVELDPNIGNCKNMTNLFLSQNELENLPEELCQCTKMVTLHVDENRLDSLPERLGAMERMVELKVSHNELSSIPFSVGLLRSLRFLHLDDNVLTNLPSELGSCARLVVLTVAHNEIEYIPPEMGNMAGLRVINLCKNLIQCLPVSFSKLHLTALWLSANQTKPLVPLQCTNDSMGGQKVLTCYMLPQVYQRTPSPVRIEDRPLTEAELEARRARRLIHFAADGEKDLVPGRLSRVPTPYPKELRALAKHSRNLKAQKKDPAKQLQKAPEEVVSNNTSSNASQSETLVSPKIKVATTSNSVSVVKTMNSSKVNEEPPVTDSVAPLEIEKVSLNLHSARASSAALTSTASYHSSQAVNYSPPSATTYTSSTNPPSIKVPSPKAIDHPSPVSSYSTSLNNKLSSSSADHSSTVSSNYPSSPMNFSAPPTNDVSQGTRISSNDTNSPSRPTFEPIYAASISTTNKYQSQPSTPNRHSTQATQFSSPEPTYSPSKTESMEFPNRVHDVPKDNVTNNLPRFDSPMKVSHQGIEFSSSGRPASIAATNFSGFPSNNHTPQRPGSLALEGSSPLWSNQRPGSLAAPINTVGIPSSLQKNRASSQSALHELSLKPFKELSRNSIQEDPPISPTARDPLDNIDEGFGSIALEAQRLESSFAEATNDRPLQSPSSDNLKNEPSHLSNDDIPPNTLSVKTNKTTKIASIQQPQSSLSSNLTKPKSGIPTFAGSSPSVKRELSNVSKENTSKSPPVSASPLTFTRIPAAFNTHKSSPVTPPPAMTRIPSGPRSRIPVSPVEKPINQTGIPMISPATKKVESRIPTFSNSSLKKKSGESSSSIQNYRVSPSTKEGTKAWTDNDQS